MKLSTTPPRRSYTPVVLPDDVPVYEVLEGRLFAVNEQGFDHLYEAGQLIVYTDEPNQHLKPLNALAWKNMTKYLDKLDKLGMEKAKETKTGFVSVKQSFMAAHAPSRRAGNGVALLGQESQQNVMGSRRANGNTRVLDTEEEGVDLEIAGSFAGEKAAANAISQ